MRSEIRWGLYILGLIAVVVLGIIFSEYTINLPAPYPFGLGFLAILFFADLAVEVCRGRSPQIISNAKDGHLSINRTKDVHIIPWYDKYISPMEKNNKSLGDMAIIFPGGVDYWGISIKSNADCPVYIFPATYLEYEQENLHVHANLKRYELEELSTYLRYAIKHWGYRIKKSTPIYYGVTSHLDGSAIPDNLKIELKERQDNKEVSALEGKLDTMYKEFRREEDRKKKPIVVKELGSIEEE